MKWRKYNETRRLAGNRVMRRDSAVRCGQAGAAENLLINGGFEDGVSGPWWTADWVTMDVVKTLEGATVPKLRLRGSSVCTFKSPGRV